jgi:hypothetical protein
MKLATFLNKTRLARVLGPLLLLGLLATFIRPGPPPPVGGARTARLFAAPVALDPDDPGRRRVGGLIFRRGWVLTSDDRRFGGISAMHVEGGRVLALADTGIIFRFALPARSGGVEPMRVAPLAEGPGDANVKWDRDSESLAMAGGEAWIGFEGANAIWRYRRSDGRAESHATPPAMRHWPSNNGPESVARLDGGRFLVIAEDRDTAQPFSRALLFSGDPAMPGTPTLALRYRRVAGARPTDAAQMPDGRVLVLNRHFGWLSGLWATLAVADLHRLAPGGIIEPRPVATLAPPLTVDNMEALSLGCANGRTIVYIASDDNLMPIQRSLLLEFELAPPFAGRCR